MFLELLERKVLLVGGGRVTREKVGRLLEAGADLTVVAPELHPDLHRLAEAGDFVWLPRHFEAQDTSECFLVVSATDDGSVNRSVADAARASGALVNAADDVENCDYILPSVVSRGRITLAASTGGSSPAMARWLRGRLEESLTEEVVALADLVAEARWEARERVSICASRCQRTATPPPLSCRDCPNTISADTWQEAMCPAVLDLLGASRVDEARSQLRQRLGFDAPLQEVSWWIEERAT